MGVLKSWNILALIVSASSVAIAVTLWGKWWKKNYSKIDDANTENLADEKTVPGLLNVGNSCFMGSVLQSLASSKMFMCWLDVSAKQVQSDHKRTYFATTLLKLMKDLTNKPKHSSVTSYLDPSFVLDDLCCRGWTITMDQQDAHEFLQVVMATLREENEHIESSTNNCYFSLNNGIPITKSSPRLSKKKQLPLQGRILTKLTCTKCGKTLPVRCSNFVSISVPIPQGNLLKKFSIADCLDNFLKQEILENVECENCTIINNNLSKGAEHMPLEKIEDSLTLMKQKTKIRTTFNPKMNLNQQTDYKNQKISSNLKTQNDSYSKTCKVFSHFLKQEWIGKFPDCLCIHIQRLVWSVGMPIKRSDFVHFPEILHLSKYAFSGRRTITQSNSTKQERGGFNQTNTKTIQSILSCVNNPVLNMALQARRQEGLLGGSSNSSQYTTDNIKSTLSSVNPTYELDAVIVHLGGWSFSGHFVCYRKITGMDKDKQAFVRWLYISDTTVRLASKTEVFSVPAYMLIYNRK